MRAFLGIMAVVSSFLHQSILAQPDLDKIELVKAGKCSEARADWWGFDAANSTEFLQAAIDSGAKRLVVPNMGSAWIVNPIALASDQEIVFEPGVVVEAIRGGFHGKSDCLFSAKSKRNIILKGQDTVFRMHKKDYQDKSQYEPAEWRSGLGLYSCENVQVSGITIKSTGGDGIYVGSCRVPTNYCKDIVVRDCVLDDNHRQGMSVISVVNLLLENCVISNTRGTAPQAGIDFEPNSSKERLFGIVIKNCRFENNAGGAIILSSRVTTNSEPVSFHFENCVAFENRFTGGFGRNPPMDLVSVTMTNCVERFQGTERILNDFWVDWQNMKALDEQQRAIVAKTGHVSLRELKLQPLKKEGASKPGNPTRQPILRGKARFVRHVGHGDHIDRWRC